MAKDVFDNFPAPADKDSRSYCGGVEMKDVKPLPYSPPKGPTEQMRERPGLGGTNHGNAGTQGKH